MKYKLLVLDVDGTLLNKEKEISPRTLSTLLKIQQMGVRIVLASGRPTFGIRPIALKLELDKNDGFILSYNGGQIISMQKEELLFEKRINPEMLAYLEKKATESGFDVFTYHQDKIYTNNPFNEYITREAHINRMGVLSFEHLAPHIDFAPCKFMKGEKIKLLYIFGRQMKHEYP